MSLYEAIGCIHIHSKFSDGSGKVPEIAQAAENAGLDFIVVTDHHTIKARDRGLGKYYDRTLVIVGHETGQGKGHLLVIDTPRKIRACSHEPAEIIRKAEEQGGLSFIVHPDGEPKPEFGIGDSRWKMRGPLGFTGLEVWSYMYDWINHTHWWNLPWKIFRPDRALTGPRLQTLNLWDRLAQKQRVVGMGGVDAHAKRIVPGLKIFPYQEMFQTIRNHLLLEHPLTGNYSKDKRSVLSALKSGHCFFAMDKPNNSTGFRFQAQVGNRTYLMGDSIPSPEEEVVFSGISPSGGHTVLFRNGQPCFENQSGNWDYQTGHSGVYRVEVKIQQKPWIFSNPIYLGIWS